MASVQTIETETLMQVCELTLDRDEDGKRITIEKACKIIGVNPSTFYMRCITDEKLAEVYALTRKAQTLSDLDDLGRIEDKVQDGDLSPDVARVLIGSKQWRMAELHKKAFGDSQSIDLTARQAPDLTGLSDETIAEIKAKLLSQIGGGS